MTYPSTNWKIVNDTLLDADSLKHRKSPDNNHERFGDGFCCVNHQ